MNNFWSGFEKQAIIQNSGRFALSLLKKTKEAVKPMTDKVVALTKPITQKAKPVAEATFRNVTKRPGKYIDL